jgi:hypothetical protein
VVEKCIQNSVRKSEGKKQPKKKKDLGANGRIILRENMDWIQLAQD